MTRRPRQILLVLAVCLLVTLVACSKDRAVTTGDVESGGGESAAGKMIVAVDTEYPPFAFRDYTTGDYAGFEIDLIAAICEVNGWNYEIKSVNYDDLFSTLEQAEADLAVSAISINSQRAEKVTFSLPYFRAGLCIAVKAANEEISGIADITGGVIGVQAATTGAALAGEIRGAQVVEYSTVTEAFMALKSGEVDAVINDFPVTAYFIREGNSDIKIVGDLLTEEYYGIALPKSKPQLLEKVNSALNTIKQKGKYLDIYQKWFNEEPPAYLPGKPPAS